MPRMFSCFCRTNHKVKAKEQDDSPTFVEMMQHYDELVEQVHFKLSLKSIANLAAAPMPRQASIIEFQSDAGGDKKASIVNS